MEEGGVMTLTRIKLTRAQVKIAREQIELSQR
jgi:hypothetical protein